MTQTTVDRLSAEGTSGFKTIPEIDFWKETTLQEIGVNDFNDLAKADLRELVVTLGMNPAVLVRAADRAVLVHLLGAAAAESSPPCRSTRGARRPLHPRRGRLVRSAAREGPPPPGPAAHRGAKDGAGKEGREGPGSRGRRLQLDRLAIEGKPAT